MKKFIAAMAIAGIVLPIAPAKAHVPDRCFALWPQITDEEVKEEMHRRYGDDLEGNDSLYLALFSDLHNEMLSKRLWSVIDCAAKAGNP